MNSHYSDSSLKYLSHPQIPLSNIITFVGVVGLEPRDDFHKCTDERL